MSTFSPRSVKQVHNFLQYNYSSWDPHLLMWFIYCMYFCIQMGSYFGYAVATTDINSDGWVGVCLAHRPFFPFLFYSLVLAWQKIDGISVNGRLQIRRCLSLNDCFWLQDDRSVGWSSYVHGPRLWQPSGRNGPGLRLPAARPTGPGAPSIPPDWKPGVW